VNGHFGTTADFAYCEHCGTFEQRLPDHQRTCDEYLPSHEMSAAIKLLNTLSPDEVTDEIKERYGLTVEIA
jgi:hypothetical protein